MLLILFTLSLVMNAALIFGVVAQKKQLISLRSNAAEVTRIPEPDKHWASAGETHEGRFRRAILEVAKGVPGYVFVVGEQFVNIIYSGVTILSIEGKSGKCGLPKEFYPQATFSDLGGLQRYLGERTSYRILFSLIRSLEPPPKMMAMETLVRVPPKQMVIASRRPPVVYDDADLIENLLRKAPEKPETEVEKFLRETQLISQ